MDMNAETKEVYNRLNTLEREVTSIGTQLDSISTAVQQLVHRQSQPFNWIGLGSLLVGVTLAFGTYIHTRLVPINESIIRNQVEHERIEERTGSHVDLIAGFLQKQIDDLRKED